MNQDGGGTEKIKEGRKKKIKALTARTREGRNEGKEGHRGRSREKNKYGP